MQKKTIKICFIIIILVISIELESIYSQNLSENTYEVPDEYTKLNSDTLLQDYYDSLKIQLGKVWEPKTYKPLFMVKLFGYKLTTTDESPITRDENGILYIYKNINNKDSMDILINSKFGSFDYTCLRVIESFDINNTTKNDIRYEIYDPKFGFFMEMTIFEHYTRINLAFMSDCGQLTYDGIYPYGYSSMKFSFLENNINIITNGEKISETTVETISNRLRTQQDESLIVNNNKLIEKQKTASKSITTTNYGIYHEAEYFPGTTYFNFLPWLWNTHTCVDCTILRNYPVTKGQILSDLQYYNRDYFLYDHTISKNVKVYSIGCHGDFNIDTFKMHWYFFQNGDPIFITSNDITNLWYFYNGLQYDISVYPTQSLIVPDCCYGYYVKGYSVTYGAHMAHAFIDYGAKTYIGSTVPVSPTDSDPWMTPFWWDICYYDNTAQYSTIDLCNHHSLPEYETQWYYDTDWKILGDELFRLSN